MEYYIYCIYDPEVESFDGRLNLGPLEPKEMAEQYRRAAIKMTEVQKAEAKGKKVIMIGKFDDITGKISQGNLLEIFSFKEEKEIKDESQVREESEESPNA